jgi:hypothetical protein
VSDDDRIARYLSDRAAEIELRPTSVEAVVSRAARRRRTRRGLVAASVALTVGVSAVVIAQRSEPTPGVAINPAAVTESTFDWAVVDAASGVSSFHSASALTDDGAVYTLSTAPGATAEDTWRDPKTLYRSVDGAEWAPVALPGDFWASSLAGAGDQLYAVGTSPEGGGVGYRVVTSGDGGGTWSTTVIPSAPGDLAARYPGEVSVAPPVIAVHGDTVVVTASVYAYPDYAARLPGGLPPDSTVLDVTEDGVVMGQMTCEVVAPTTTAVPEDATAAGGGTTRMVAPDGAATSGVGPTTTVVPDELFTPGDAPATTVPTDAADAAVDAEAAADDIEAALVEAREAVQVAEPCAWPDPASGQTYTWAQLGIGDELQELVLHGRTMVFVSQGGGEFTTVDLGDAAVSGAQAVATDDGFTLFLARSPVGPVPPDAFEPTTEVLRSADGVTWEPAGELPGFIYSAGSVAGRPAIALGDIDGNVTIQLGQADGSWLPVDPGHALEPEGGMVGPVAFGPLGWAAVVWPESPDGPTQVVHSLDGTVLSVVPLDDLVAPEQIGSIDTTVTADAVVVRITEPDDGVVGTPARQRVVVGTPPA